jgi:hypothetical protein
MVLYAYAAPLNFSTSESITFSSDYFGPITRAWVNAGKQKEPFIMSMWAVFILESFNARCARMGV